MTIRPQHSKRIKIKAARPPSALLELTARQRKVVDAVVDLGMGRKEALAYAGYKNPVGSYGDVYSNPPVIAAMQEKFVHAQQYMQLKREDVLDGMKEAIDMAKLQANPEVMIQGWREIGRMCGYYAPEVKKIQLDVSHKRLMSQFETLSDEELLKIASDNAKVIEAEVLEVKDTLKNANSDDLLSNVIDHIGN